LQIPKNSPNAVQLLNQKRAKHPVQDKVDVKQEVYSQFQVDVTPHQQVSAAESLATTSQGLTNNLRSLDFRHAESP